MEDEHVTIDDALGARIVELSRSSAPQHSF
jgi:hypothetical protein